MNKLTISVSDAIKIPMPSESVNLVMMHPPYFGISVDRYGDDPYKQINTLPLSKMMKKYEKINKEIFRVLKPQGHLVFAMGTGNGVDHRYFLNLFDKIKMFHASTVIQNSYDEKNLYLATSEMISSENLTTWYHFVKSPMAYKNPYKVKKYNNPVWNLPFNNIKDPVDLELSKHHFVEDVINKEVPTRFIEMLTKQGDVVLDPFGGSGIIPITAVELGRVGVCLDISSDQVDAAKKRAELVFGAEKYKKLIGKND